MAAILKIQNGGRYSSQITCLHFLYDSNNKKLSIHKISCFYDNLNNIATNRSTIIDIWSPVAVYLWLLIFVNVGITAAAHHVPSNGHMPAMDERRANICQKKTLIQRRWSPVGLSTSRSGRHIFKLVKIQVSSVTVRPLIVHVLKFQLSIATLTYVNKLRGCPFSGLMLISSFGIDQILDVIKTYSKKWSISRKM